MTVKVIGAGFGRTGTLSLKVALERLGFDAAHHMVEVGKSRSQIDHWSRIAGGGEPRWDDVFDGYQSTTDFPACVYYAELAEHYPEAKVLLTVRDEDSWHRSVIETIWKVREVVPVWLKWLAPPVRRMFAAVDAIVWQGVFSGRADDADHAKSVFRAHNEAVVKQIPPERLLVFQVKEGWEPLCRFLEVAVPDEPFPHVNDTAEMQRRIKWLRLVNWLPLVLLAGAGYLVFG